MSTAILSPGTPGITPTEAAALRPAPARIPFSRLMAVELRKSFDTRAGFWLLASIGITAVLATGAVILFAPDSELTYSTFASAIGFPMAVILPMVAILSVTSEWSQRSGLTTFALVPHRGRTILAKGTVTVAVGVVSMVVAMAVGAVGTVLGSAIVGVDRVWDATFLELACIVLAQVLGMVMGFMLGTVLRNSPAAIVGYFVVGFVLVPVTEVLAQTQDWFHDLRPWVDFNFTQGSLFNGVPDASEWAQLGVTGLLWLVVPLGIGLVALMRSEVK